MSVDKVPPGSRREDETIPELIRSAHEGSPAALGQLLEICRRYLLLVASRELPQGLHAKVAPSDLVQDTWLEAWRDFSHFTGKSRPEFLAWLRRILLNNVTDVVRRYQEVEKREAGREVPLVRSGSPSRTAGELPLDTDLPEDRAVTREDAERLQSALAHLPADYRTVIELHHRDGRPLDEIAVRMNRSVDAVRKLWSRGVRQLQHYLDSDDGSG
jgi:RNA polymerase sigma-70 factor (ECF subfamily)